MSNQSERKAIERELVDTYKDLLLCLRAKGLTVMSPWELWGEGARFSSARFHALKTAARVMGMGDFDYDRCDRVINGLQHSHEVI